MRPLTRDVIEIVNRSAAPADQQRAHLRRLGSHPALDELALELDDVLGAELVTPERPSSEALQRLGAQLVAMSGEDNADPWTVDALDGVEWQVVRQLAVAALTVRPRSER